MAAFPESDAEAQLIEAQTPLEEDQNDSIIDKELGRLENFLRIFGFCQFTPLTCIVSWVLFVLISIVVPVLVIESYYCSDCEKYLFKSFQLEILVFESLVAVISLGCISHSLRKYGLRKFLFVDKYHGHLSQFRDQYIQKITGIFRILLVWVLPLFLVKAAHEVVRAIYVHRGSWLLSVVALLGVLVAWAYSTIIFLSATALFHLVCSLQVIHFENYGKLLERDLYVSAYIEEHIRLTHHLSKISHRFRIFLLLVFVTVTASQFVALLETTGNRGVITFINGCDFAISSTVQLVGLFFCLHAAARISHRAQGLASVTSRWHAVVTSSSRDSSHLRTSNSDGNLEGDSRFTAISISYSESDLDVPDYVPMPTSNQLAVSSYHQRQALVTYLQFNPGGATIFGWTVDRVLINTIFFVEMSLVLFVLGKTITFTTNRI